MSVPPLPARRHALSTRTVPGLPGLRIAVAAAIGLGVGVVLHLVQHTWLLLGAGDPVGRGGLGIACVGGMAVAATAGVAASLGRARGAVLGLVVAYGFGFAVAAFALGPWMTGW